MNDRVRTVYFYSKAGSSVLRLSVNKQVFTRTKLNGLFKPLGRLLRRRIWRTHLDHVSPLSGLLLITDANEVVDRIITSNMVSIVEMV